MVYIVTDKRCGGCNGRRAGLFFVLPPLQRTMPLRWIIILAVCGSSVALFMNVMLAWPLIRNWPGVTIWPYCISVRSPIYLQPPQAILHGLIDGVLQGRDVRSTSVVSNYASHRGDHGWS